PPPSPGLSASAGGSTATCSGSRAAGSSAGTRSEPSLAAVSAIAGSGGRLARERLGVLDGGPALRGGPLRPGRERGHAGARRSDGLVGRHGRPAPVLVVAAGGGPGLRPGDGHGQRQRGAPAQA